MEQERKQGKNNATQHIGTIIIHFEYVMSKITKINNKFKEQPMLPKNKKQTNHKCLCCNKLWGCKVKIELTLIAHIVWQGKGHWKSQTLLYYCKCCEGDFTNHIKWLGHLGSRQDLQLGKALRKYTKHEPPSSPRTSHSIHHPSKPYNFWSASVSDTLPMFDWPPRIECSSNGPNE